MPFARMMTLLTLLTTLSVSAQDWVPLHNLLIKFYGFQRAGAKTTDTHNPFYKTAPYPHSQDNYQGTDLSGGWYDAGDFVKFGLPFGYSTYTLLKGFDVFPAAYDDLDSWDYKGVKDGIPDILGETKIATDFMIKAVLSDASVITDVGNGNNDHQQLSESGYSNSQRTSPRSGTTATGADVAGLYAASLALMAKVYKPYDSVYSNTCLAKAKSAFAFGLAHPTLSQEQGSSATGKPFYETKTSADKMACGAVELYRATMDESYLIRAKTFQAAVGSHQFVLGYANVGDLSAFELARLGFDSYQGAWLTDVDQAMSRVVTAASAPELIKGAFIRSDWGNAGHAAAAAFSAALAFQITGSTLYKDFAIQQIKWVAGITPFKQSYVVGYLNGPTNPHHRNDVALGGTGVRVKGGIVSGPTPVGAYVDGKPEATGWTFNGSDANNYKNTEMALDYNAAAVGAVAFIRDYLNPPAGQIRITEAMKVTPDNVDLNTQTATVTFVLETAAAWKVVFFGRNSKAKKTYIGTTAAGSIKWGGEADEGAFSAGENVDIQMVDMNIASYHLARSKVSLFIKAIKKEPFKPEDILVDDFNDGDTANAMTGLWSVFTDKAATGKSYANPAGFSASVGTGGADSSKGSSIRLVGVAGAPNPVVGIRTTFNLAGTAVGLGAVKSVVFDVLSSVGSTFWVELEQSDITDGAYPAFQVAVGNDLWNRIRIPISAFAQPAWKTTTKGLNTGSVKSLRFSFHGEGTVRFTLDNVRMEGLKLSSAGTLNTRQLARSKLVSQLRATPREIAYQLSPPWKGNFSWSVEIADVTGKNIYSSSLKSGAASGWISLPVQLKPGIYFLRHIGKETNQIHETSFTDTFLVN